jgi:hypothetical protein
VRDFAPVYVGVIRFAVVPLRVSIVDGSGRAPRPSARSSLTAWMIAGPWTPSEPRMW